MNNKQIELNRIVDVVVDCCDMVTDDRHIITKDMVLGGCKRQYAVMTRSILVFQILRHGYTTETCSELLGLTAQAVTSLMSKDGEYHMTSRAYRIAKQEATERLPILD